MRTLLSSCGRVTSRVLHFMLWFVSIVTRPTLLDFQKNKETHGRKNICHEMDLLGRCQQLIHGHSEIIQQRPGRWPKSVSLCILVPDIGISLPWIENWRYLHKSLTLTSICSWYFTSPWRRLFSASALHLPAIFLFQPFFRLSSWPVVLPNSKFPTSREGPTNQVQRKGPWVGPQKRT